MAHISNRKHPTKGIFFVPEGAEEQPVLRYLDFANGHALEISFLQKQPSHIWISPSVDGKRLLLQQLDMRVSNVMLVENFRWTPNYSNTRPPERDRI